MDKETVQPQFNVFSAMLGIAFIIGLIIFEYSLYSFFTSNGDSPWLIMLVISAVYMVIAFVIISAMSGFGRVGMLLGYIVSIAGLYLFGLS